MSRAPTSVHSERSLDRACTGPHPQPIASAGEQQAESIRYDEELDAFSQWLAHVEARRIG